MNTFLVQDKKYELVPADYPGMCIGCSFYESEISHLCLEAQDASDGCGRMIFREIPQKTEEKVIPIKIAPVDAPPDQKPGTKYDGEKIQYTLIPPYALQEAARNLTVGLRKYKERDNWKKVPDAQQRYMDALYRHIEAVRRGEIYDTESGAENMPHLAAVVVNAMFILEFMLDPKLKGE